MEGATAAATLVTVKAIGVFEGTGVGVGGTDVAVGTLVGTFVGVLVGLGVGVTEPVGVGVDEMEGDGVGVGVGTPP